MAITAETRNDIIELVVTAYNAAPGTTLLSELVAIIDDGGTLADVADNLVSRSEWTSRYPSFQTAEEFATEWLGNLIPEASADSLAEGVDIAVGLVNGGASFGSILIEAQSFLSTLSEDDAAFGTSAANFNNKVEVATNHTITQEKADLDTSALSGVTSDDATVTTANAAVDAVAPVAGQSFSLTTGLDTGASYTGGAGDDNFVGVDNNTATVGTLTAGDSLVGGEGSDTLTIAASGTASAPVVSTSGIETLAVTNNSGAGVSYSAALMDGLTDLSVTAGLNATTITSSLALLDVTATNTSKNITVTSAAKALGPSDSSNITLNGVGTSASGTTITSDGVETFNVTLTGAASGSATYGNVTLASTELETVTVTGDVGGRLTVDLTGADNVDQVATFDASATTAGVRASLTAGGSTKLSATGGSGNDVLTVGALDKDYTIEGGDGTDTLVATGGDYSATAAAAGTLVGVGVTGFEQISADSAGSVDFRVMPNNTFVATTGAGTYSKAGSSIADSYLTAASGTLTLTRATDGAADTLNVHLKAVTAATVTVSVADEETLTIASAGLGSNIDHTISTLTASDIESLTVIGHNGLVISSLVGEEDLATVDAGAHTGKAFTINATDSNVAMTVTGSAGAPITDGGTVNTITTGSKADSITGGAYKDIITSGLGNDTVVAGAGDDTVTSSNGADSVDGGDGNDTLTTGSGNDTVIGGAGNDKIDAGTGTDSIDAGAGTDYIKATISDTTVIDGGTGSDRLADTTGTITSSSAASVAGALINVAESVTPSISGVETMYLLVDADASAQAAATTVIVDLASATDLATLHLGTDETSQDGSYMKIKDFAGSTLKMYGGISGTTEEVEFVTIDGVGQAAINMTLENWNGASDADVLTVTGTDALNITGRSTSQFTGSAAQDNLLGDITAASVATFSVTTSGSTTTTNGASALTIDVVTATQASTVNLSVGANDDLALDIINATGDAVENSTITVGADGILDLDTLNFDASTLDQMTITLSDGATMTNSTNASVVTTEYVDLTATSVADMDITVGSGAGASLDLTGITMTDLDASIDSSGLLVLKSSLGKASTDSNFTFTGRGDLDFDDATRQGNSSVALLGGTVVFNTSGLSKDTDAVAVHSSATVKATITTGAAADRVSGGAGNDVISTGSGDDIVGLTGRTETISFTTVDENDTYIITVNGVPTESQTVAAAETDNNDAAHKAAVAEQAAAAINDKTETNFATATSDGAVVTITYQQFISGAIAENAITDVGDNDVTANTIAASAAGDNAGADTITLGEGADTVFGGSGNDTIKLAEVTSAADTVDFNLSGTAGYDTITGFETTSDKLSFDGITTSITATSGTAVAADADATTVTDAAVYVFADGADGTGSLAITDYTDLDEVAAFLAGAFSDEEADDEFVAVINDTVGEKSYIYYVDFDDGNGGTGALDDEAVKAIGVVTETDGAVLVDGDIG